jgi:CRISPR-associated protein Cas5d
MLHPAPLEVRISGDWACFTRPEMKVERVSYPVPTPSAARGALEAIFWKPEFDWVVEEIHVLKPIRYFSMLRNEVNKRQSDKVAKTWTASGGGYDAAGDRAQRHTLGLRDVAYLIRARMALRPHATDDVAKYQDQFRRRVERGQCFATPFLGCREFSAEFGPPRDGERAIEGLNDDLGPMLLDMDFVGGGNGRAKPRFFRARLSNGVLHVPNRFAEVT